MTSANGFIDRTARTAGKLPLPRIVATMLGAAAAFFCFAMPQGVLDTLLGSLGVPTPVGPVGRTLFLLVFAGLSAGLGWLVVTVAGGAGTAAPPEPEIDVAPAEPRRRSFRPSDPSEALNAPVPTLLAVRRSDAHPDAPPRRPIFADHDLAPLGGEFADADEEVVVVIKGEADIEIVAEPAEPVSSHDGMRADTAATEPEAATAVAAEDEAQVEPGDSAADVGSSVGEEPFDLTEPLPSTIDSALTEPTTSAEDAMPEQAAAEAAPIAAEADAANTEELPPITAVPPVPTSERPLGELMARLETGLDRRSGELPPPPRVDTVRLSNEPALAPEETLRQALEALQRMASRQR